jgi:hypothetical protein
MIIFLWLHVKQIHLPIQQNHPILSDTIMLQFPGVVATTIILPTQHSFMSLQINCHQDWRWSESKLQQNICGWKEEKHGPPMHCYAEYMVGKARGEGHCQNKGAAWADEHGPGFGITT